MKAWERDELLSRLPRIRRGGDLPTSIQHEIREHAKYPHRAQLRAGGVTISLRYRKSRWRRMADDGVVRQRRVFCWIRIGDERVGALEFVEFDADDWATNEEFFETMDTECAADAALGEALCAEWEDVPNDICAYGPILEFRMAWMQPAHARSALWAAAARHLMTTLFGTHAILVMKAFPLEYEQRAPEGSAAHAGLLSRQAAMVRYYRRLFDVEPLPRWPGEEGWLWRAHPRLAGVLTVPSYSAESLERAKDF